MRWQGCGEGGPLVKIDASTRVTWMCWVDAPDMLPTLGWVESRRGLGFPEILILAWTTVMRKRASPARREKEVRQPNPAGPALTVTLVGWTRFGLIYGYERISIKVKRKVNIWKRKKVLGSCTKRSTSREAGVYVCVGKMWVEECLCFNFGKKQMRLRVVCWSWGIHTHTHTFLLPANWTK